MKKKMLLIACIALIGFNCSVQSQWIQSLTIIPANPVTGDTITVLAACSFPSGGCSDHSQTLSVAGTNVLAGALHCLGPLTVICNYTDTFKIDPLPAGSYTFHFQVDAGFGPSPCTPGIIPGPSDSVSFIVSPAAGLTETIYQDAVNIFPNPVDDQFQITGIDAGSYPVVLEIFSPEGKRIHVVSVKNELQKIDISALPSAMYQLRLTPPDGSQIIIQALKNE